MTMNKFHFNEHKQDTLKCDWLIGHIISISLKWTTAIWKECQSLLERIAVYSGLRRNIHRTCWHLGTTPLFFFFFKKEVIFGLECQVRICSMKQNVKKMRTMKHLQTGLRRMSLKLYLHSISPNFPLKSWE